MLADASLLGLLIGLLGIALLGALYFGLDINELVRKALDACRVPFRIAAIVSQLMNLTPFVTAIFIAITIARYSYKNDYTKMYQQKQEELVSNTKAEAEAVVIKDLEALRRTELNRLYFSTSVSLEQKKLYEPALRTASTMSGISEIAKKF